MEAEKLRKTQRTPRLHRRRPTDDASQPAEAERRLSQPRSPNLHRRSQQSKRPRYQRVRLSPSRTSFRRSRRWRNRKSSFRRSLKRKRLSRKQSRKSKSLQPRTRRNTTAINRKTAKSLVRSPTASGQRGGCQWRKVQSQCHLETAYAVSRIGPRVTHRGIGSCTLHCISVRIGHRCFCTERQSTRGL